MCTVHDQVRPKKRCGSRRSAGSTPGSSRTADEHQQPMTSTCASRAPAIEGVPTRSWALRNSRCSCSALRAATTSSRSHSRRHRNALRPASSQTTWWNSVTQKRVWIRRWTSGCRCLTRRRNAGSSRQCCAASCSEMKPATSGSFGCYSDIPRTEIFIQEISFTEKYTPTYVYRLTSIRSTSLLGIVCTLLCAKSFPKSYSNVFELPCVHGMGVKKEPFMSARSWGS